MSKYNPKIGSQGIKSNVNAFSDDLKFRPYSSQPCNSNEEYVLINGYNLSQSFQKLEGKMLTIIESAITDERQLNAIKSLIKNDIWSVNADLYVCMLTAQQVQKI